MRIYGTDGKSQGHGRAKEAIEAGRLKAMSREARARLITFYENAGRHAEALATAMLVQKLDEWGE